MRDGGVEVLGIASVVVSGSSVHFFTAATVDGDVQSPTALLRALREGSNELRSRASLESVQDDESRCGLRCMQSPHVEKVIVVSLETLDDHRDVVTLAKELPPKGLTMTVR